MLYDMEHLVAMMQKEGNDGGTIDTKANCGKA